MLIFVDCSHKCQNLITNTFAVKLVKITAVLLRVLEAEFKIFGFPPRRWNIEVSLGPGDDKVSFTLDTFAYQNRGNCTGIKEGDFAE